MKPYDRLLEHNIKPSMQRIAIMEYLMDNPIHPSADDIYTALSPSMPTLSKTTVYNTLKLFSEQGAALMLTIDYSPETRKEQQQHHGAPYKQAAQPRDGWKARNSPETQPSAIEKMAWQAQLMLYAYFLCLVSEPVYLLPTPAVCTCPWEP